MTRFTGGGLTNKPLILTLCIDKIKEDRVDFFSGNPIDIDHTEINKIKEKEINLAEISENWLLAEQRRDSQISEIVTKLQNDELAENIANT